MFLYFSTLTHDEAPASLDFSYSHRHFRSGVVDQGKEIIWAILVLFINL